MDTSLGTEVAGFRIESLLGRGGMSVVYLAEQAFPRRKVALKLLAPELASDTTFRDRFVTESNAAASLDHPNVIPIFSAGEFEGVLYIAMRYVEGTDLQGLIEKAGPLAVDRAVGIVSQVASALDAAHSRELVHRDVKPSNILITSLSGSEHAYLADFGIVKRRKTSDSFTETETFLGSIDYVAPEQIQGDDVDARADIYSLGCVLYECLVGAPPFRRSGEMATLYAHVNDDIPKASSQRDDLSPAVDDIIGRALAKVVQDRFQTPAEFATALERLLKTAVVRTQIPGLQGRAPTREVRKTVTVVFTDVTDSTSLGEKLDPESFRRLMSRYFEVMRSVLERHGGTVEKFIGDAVMAVFGIPQLHEDDSLRAVRAASEMRDALGPLNDELEQSWGVRINTRTGVSTGEVVAGDSSGRQGFATGRVVNTAARLQQAAKPGEILIGESTYRLGRDAVIVEPLDPLSLKGKAEPVASYRLLSIGSATRFRSKRFESRMVGRDRELGVLSDALARATRERCCQLVTMLGAPGVGKSRLVEEFALGAENATVLRGRCLPYGEGITFWPVAEAVKQVAKISERDDPAEARRKITALLEDDEEASLIEERTAQAVGLAEPTVTVQEVFWGIRKLLESLARKKPLVAIMEDIHWAEPTLLDLIEHVAEWTKDAPVLLVCPARPELIEARPSWGSGEHNHTSLLLEPLTAEESDQFVQDLLGQSRPPVELQKHITEAAEGNPLFVEEMFSMLVEDGILRADDGRWTLVGDLSSLAVPATVQSLLAARLDVLSETEQVLLETASVVGKVFYRGAVEALLSDALRPELDSHLAALVRKELIRPEPSTFAGGDTFEFRHVLIRDAAYHRIPKEARAENHERFAGWLEGQAGDRLVEYEEIVGFHIEQAYRLRTELDLLDEKTQALARKAARSLLAAGVRARARGDGPAAVNLLSRADALWRADDRERVALLISLSDSMDDVGDGNGAEGALVRAERAAAASGDTIARDYAAIARLTVRWLTEAGVEQIVSAEIERMQSALERAGDAYGLTRLWGLRRNMHWGRLQIAAAEADLQELIRYATVAGDERRRIDSLVMLAACAWTGPTEVEEAIRRCDNLLEQVRPNRIGESEVRVSQAILVAMRGDFDRGRELYALARTIAEEMGMVKYAAGDAQASFYIEMLAGHPEAAERELTLRLPMLVDAEDRWDLPTNASMLAMALYRQDRLDEALEWSEVSRATAAENDLDGQSRWHMVEALIMARRGLMQEAERLSTVAVQLLEGSDFLHGKALLMMDRADVLALMGRAEEATKALRRALDLFERKGNVVGAADARNRLGDPGSLVAGS